MQYLMSFILAIVFLPITVLGSWLVVHPREEKIILFWGKQRALLKEQGLYFYMLWGRSVITISTKKQAIELHKTTVADKNGNPINIAAICTYQVKDSIKSAFNVENYDAYLRTQAIAVLKQISSKYPYESPDGHCLKSEAAIIGQEMVDVLQEKVESAGISVIAFELSDLSYAPEIAQAMLVRQQAQALVGARKIVVEGAVGIVHDAIQMLDESGIKVPENTKTRLIANLLVIICADSKVQPTYSIQESDEDDMLMKRVLLSLEEIKKNTKTG
jgi:regulator of protease activity HflC (stomatin/prohibitin superfamily)